jgi:hypothetical protein
MSASFMRLTFAAIAATGAVALAGCGAAAATGTTDASSAAAVAPATSAAAAPSPTASGIPDPCALLTSAEVTQLTGHAVTQIDQDGLDTTATTRHCQWQLASGDLAIFLSTTTADDFKVRDPAAVDVSGVGDEAYTSSGHLFVRLGEKQLDVYSTGASDDAGNLAVEKATADKLLPKL